MRHPLLASACIFLWIAACSSSVPGEGDAQAPDVNVAVDAEGLVDGTADGAAVDASGPDAGPPDAAPSAGTADLLERASLSPATSARPAFGGLDVRTLGPRT